VVISFWRGQYICISFVKKSYITSLLGIFFNSSDADISSFLLWFTGLGNRGWLGWGLKICIALSRKIRGGWRIYWAIQLASPLPIRLTPAPLGQVLGVVLTAITGVVLTAITPLAAAVVIVALAIVFLVLIVCGLCWISAIFFLVALLLFPLKFKLI